MADSHQSFGEASWGYLNAIRFGWWLLTSVVLGAATAVVWLLSVSLILTGALGGAAALTFFLFFLAWRKYEGDAPVLTLDHYGIHPDAKPRKITNEPVDARELSERVRAAEMNVAALGQLATVAHSAATSIATRIDASSAIEHSYARPNIEFVNSEVGLRWGDEKDWCLRKADAPGEPNTATMLARFYYTPAHDVPPEMRLISHISIATSDGKPIKTRYDGTWDGKCDSPTRTVGTSQTTTLVVALFPPIDLNKRESILTWGFDLRNKQFWPEQRQLKGSSFIVRVELVGKHSNKVVLHDAFDFSLNVKRQSLDFIKKESLL